MKRNGAECKAYHDWYDAAYVFFSSFDGLKGLDDFKKFVNAKKDGSCFVLEHIYDSISASYTEEEIAWAEEMVQLTAEANAEGKGVAVKDNKFIGPPMLKMAEKILNKQKLIDSNSRIIKK